MHCLLVDDNEQTAAGLGAVIRAGYPGFSISTAATVRDAIFKVANASPPVTLTFLDLVMPDQNGTAFLSHFQNHPPREPFETIIVSGMVEGATVDLCKSLGAKGYIRKSMASELIHQAIDAVLQGKEYFATDDLMTKSEAENCIALNARLSDIASAFLAGLGNKQIAEQLNLSDHTVKNSMLELMRTFGATSRQELAEKLRANETRTRRL